MCVAEVEFTIVPAVDNVASVGFTTEICMFIGMIAVRRQCL